MYSYPSLDGAARPTLIPLSPAAQVHNRCVIHPSCHHLCVPRLPSPVRTPPRFFDYVHLALTHTFIHFLRPSSLPIQISLFAKSSCLRHPTTIYSPSPCFSSSSLSGSIFYLTTGQLFLCTTIPIIDRTKIIQSSFNLQKAFRRRHHLVIVIWENGRITSNLSGAWQGKLL